MFNSKLKKRVLELERELKKMKAVHSFLVDTIHLYGEEIKDLQDIQRIDTLDILELQSERVPKNEPMSIIERFRAWQG